MDTSFGMQYPPRVGRSGWLKMCSVCVWLGPRLGIRLGEVTAYGGLKMQ